MKSNRGAEGKDEGKEKAGNYIQHVNAWFSQLHLWVHPSAILQENQYQHLSMKHSGEHILLWVCLGWKGKEKGEEAGRRTWYIQRETAETTLL